jgi:hypothetical protein
MGNCRSKDEVGEGGSIFNELPIELWHVIIVMMCNRLNCGVVLRLVCKQWKYIADQNRIPKTISLKWVTNIRNSII